MQRGRAGWRHALSGMLVMGMLPLFTSVALGGTALAGAGVRTSGITTLVAGDTGNAASGAAPTSCELGNGVKHAIEITFDNVHFFRDNPNVPSDLEMMPHLLDFIEQNGTMLSNNHTPLIAHTADDILTTLTGLYGDRQGMPIANDYQAYNTDGTTDPASSFAYWTDPVYDTAGTPNPSHDTNPNMVYSATPPATTTPHRRRTPRRPLRGCRSPGPVVTSVGSPRPISSWRTTRWTSPRSSGRTRPRCSSWPTTRTPYKDPETADYVGIAVHCAQQSTFCSTAQAVKYGQTTPSPTAVRGRAAERAGRLHRLPGAVRPPLRCPAARRRHPERDRTTGTR